MLGVLPDTMGNPTGSAVHAVGSFCHVPQYKPISQGQHFLRRLRLLSDNVHLESRSRLCLSVESCRPLGHATSLLHPNDIGGAFAWHLYRQRLNQTACMQTGRHTILNRGRRPPGGYIPTLKVPSTYYRHLCTRRVCSFGSFQSRSLHDVENSIHRRRRYHEPC